MPGLACLSLYLHVLERALDDGTNSSTCRTSQDRPWLEPSRIGDLGTEGLVGGPLRVECLKDTELGGAEDDGAKERWDEASVETNWSLLPHNFLNSVDIALLLPHVLAHGLHLRGHCVEGVAHDSVGASVEEAGKTSEEELLLPIATLLVVRHYLFF